MKLLYSVLDKKGHEWKKRFSSILMQEALVEPLDEIFESPRYADDVKIKGYVEGKRLGPIIKKVGTYNIYTLLSANKKPKDERLVLITFDDFLVNMRGNFSKGVTEKMKGKVMNLEISTKDMEMVSKHMSSKDLEGEKLKENEYTIDIASGGATFPNLNSVVVSFVEPPPFSFLNAYPIPFVRREEYVPVIIHELTESLLKEECKDNEPCIGKWSEGYRYFGEKCKKELERLYL